MKKALIIPLIAGASLVSCLNKADTKIQNSKEISVELKTIIPKDTSYRHIVKQGDTGEGIANTYYDNPKEVAYLEMANPNKDMNKLKVGDTIIVGYKKDIKYGLREERVEENLKPNFK